MGAEGEMLTILHHLGGYIEAREFTDEEKEKLGFNKNDCCGILGEFGLDKLPPFLEK